jgi:tetratricopeptide (TPR) repeat protein
LKFYSKIIILSFFYNSSFYAQSINYYLKGKEEFFTGSYVEGLKSLLKVESNSAQKDMNYFIAMSYFNLHRYDSAIIFFHKDLLQNTRNYNSYFKKAQAEKNLGQFKESLMDLDKLLELDKNYFLAYYEKGEVNFEKKSYTLAIDFYKKALAIKPHFESAFYRIGFCYLNLKDTFNACENWKKIEDLDDFEEYQKIEVICNERTKTK